MGHLSNSAIDWTTVASDGGLSVLVIDPQGRVVSANNAAGKLFAGRAARDLTGQRLSDFLPGPAASERLEFVRQVLASGEPLVVRDLWAGIALRCTLRRIDNLPDANGPAVLVVCCQDTALLEESSEHSARVVEARHIDLGPLSKLTSSELKVLALIGEGLSNAEIAARLHRAVKTVESHRAALTDKTGSASRVQLGIMARRAGLSRRLGPSIASGDNLRVTA